MDATPAQARIPLDVFLRRERLPVSGEMDPARWPIVAEWPTIRPRAERGRFGDDIVPLAEVEVPADADVDSLSKVELRASLHPGYFPGVPTSLVDGLGVVHFVYADRILDVASNPNYAGLGITLVRDLRGAGQMAAGGAR